MKITQISVFLLSVIVASAQIPASQRTATKGAIAGAAIGAVVGNNSNSHDTVKGAAIGAVGGYILGTVVGQASQVRRPGCMAGYPQGYNAPGLSSYPSSGLYETRYNADSRLLARQQARSEAEEARRRFESAEEAVRQAQAYLELAAARVRSTERTLQELGGY